MYKWKVTFNRRHDDEKIVYLILSHNLADATVNANVRLLCAFPEWLASQYEMIGIVRKGKFSG